MEYLLRLGRWVADGPAQRNAQDERRRTLFALQLIHFFLFGMAWLLCLVFMSSDDDLLAGSDERATVSTTVVTRSFSKVDDPGLRPLLDFLERLNRTRHFHMLILNSTVAAVLLAMLRGQVRLSLLMALWVTYISAHAVYYALYYPNLGAEKWYLPSPFLRNEIYNFFWGQNI